MRRLLLVVCLLSLTSVPAWPDHCQTLSHAGDATVDTTAGGTVIMQRNTTRCHALVQNAGSVAARCRGDGGAPTTSQGVKIVAGSVMTLDSGEAVNAWACIAETSSTTIIVTEVFP